MLTIKPSLTQTEKQRFLVDDPRMIYSNSPIAFSWALKLRTERIAELRRNTVDDRLFRNKLRNIEKDKHKSVAKINREKYMVKSKYLHILQRSGAWRSDSTFYTQPGFRYKRNGQIKSEKSNNIPQVMKLTDSLNDDAVNNTTPDALSITDHGSSYGSDYCSTDLDDDDELESPFEYLPLPPDADSPSQNGNNSAVDPVAVWASGTVRKKNTDRDEDFEESYRKKTHAFCERFYRKCTRSKCIACEFSMKCNSNLDSYLQKSQHSSVIPWKPAPHGYLVESSQLLTPHASRSQLMNNEKSELEALESLLKLSRSSDENAKLINPVLEHYKKTGHLDVTKSCEEMIRGDRNENEHEHAHEHEEDTQATRDLPAPAQGLVYSGASSLMSMTPRELDVSINKVRAVSEHWHCVTSHV